MSKRPSSSIKGNRSRLTPLTWEEFFFQVVFLALVLVLCYLVVLHLLGAV